MRKSTSFTGQPVLAQLFSLIPGDLVSKIVSEEDSDRYYKKFRTNIHLITMMFAAISGASSLREVVTGLSAFQTRLQHLGLKFLPARSTLAEANKNRKSAVFGRIYYALLKFHSKVFPDSRVVDGVLRDLYVIDSTTISLFKAVLNCAGRKPKSGKSKGGIKAHVLMKYSDLLPHFVDYTAASRHDRRFLDKVDLRAGAIVAMDKAYNDYKLFVKWSKKGIKFVTRQKVNAVFKVIETLPIATSSPAAVRCDQIIEHDMGAEGEPLRLRRIEYYDEKNDKILVFISNIFDLEPEQVAEIYKCRWEIECLFKRLKQNFPLKYFLGDSPNAIEIQIWCSLIANLLFETMSRKLKRRWAFSNLCSMIRIHLASYIDLWKFLEDPDGAWRKPAPEPDAQLSLFPK
jgi:hypothetical protein